MTTNPDHPTYPNGCTIAYLRVSTEEQVESGAGLDAQREGITRYCERAGLTVDLWLTEDACGGSVPPLERPQLAKALGILAGCRAGVLIVGKVDRICRNTADLLRLRDLTEREGWVMSAADGSIDWSTPHGRAMTTVLGAFAELERDLIRSRTKEALAARRAAGVTLGRPVVVSSAVQQRIRDERAAGSTWSSIADGLNRDEVPTAHGGWCWYPATVQRIAQRA